VDEELVSQICDLFNSRVSPVAARLALSKCRGIARAQKLQVACDWLLDDKNVDEMEAAENADIEKTAAEELALQRKAEGFTSSAESSGRQACRNSTSSDDGRGLGFFMCRKSLSSPQWPSEPSPQKVPMPGRLSRGNLGRWSTGSLDSDLGDARPLLASRVSMGSQTSGQSEEGVDAADGRQEIEAEVSEEEEEQGQEEHEEDDVILQPPDSACWDWPLSRHEKKARVQQIETQMGALDRRCLQQEIDGLRGHIRKLSVGGHGQAKRPSRLSN
jgi:hypothetical protein